jgi:hypothetical protein
MIEKPKKERRFLKTLGKIGEILLQEVLIKIGSSLIKRIGGKKTLPSILFLFLSICLFAQYPATGNKQRLGYQTTGDGLVYRGRALDTMTIKSSGLNNAYFILDTVNNILYNYIKTKGGWKFSNGDTIIIQGVTMPFDSITFNTAKDGTVTVGEVEYNDTQGSLIQGLKGGLVTNVIGQQLHQRINNRTGSTLAKGTAVYLSGSQGNRITVAKALATSDPTSANTFGIVAESIANNQSGYVITEGLITNINTSALVEDSAVYLSPTVAGGLTSTKPQAPQHNVYIGVCVKSNAGSGELFVSIKNGLEITELHDVRITSPVDRASLYYKSSEGLWRDTTSTLLVSDTASMLTNYLRSGVASNTYLPLAGGTLTGALNGTTATFNTRLGVGTFTGSPSLFTGGPGNQEVHFAHNQNIAGATVTLRLTNDNAGFFDQGAYFQGIVNRGINEMSGALGTNGSEYIRLRGVDDGGIVGVGIFNQNPSYNLDLTGTFRATGNSLIGGTLGVTGATTLSNLSGSGTRMVTSSSTGLLSTQAIPIGTLVGTDTVSLSNRINLRVSLNGDETINGTKSFNNQVNVLNRMTLSGSVSGLNKLLGKNTDGNGVGDITVGSGLNLAANTLTAPVIDTASMLNPYWRPGRFSGTLPIANGGTGATSESNARTNLKVDYLFIATNAGAGVAVTTNRVFIVNSGGFSTTTLDLTTLTSGNTYMIKNLASGTVVSSANNVIPLNGGSASTPILSAGNVTPQWCTLVCDGTNWHIMQKN